MRDGAEAKVPERTKAAKGRISPGTKIVMIFVAHSALAHFSVGDYL
jgi:hypothetical protein